MSRITRRIGESVEFIDGKGYSELTQEEEKKLLFNSLADCEDKLENKKYNTMSAVLDLETLLYKQTEKPFEIRATIFWGALMIAKKSGRIDWDGAIFLFGEFISKLLNLR